MHQTYSPDTRRDVSPLATSVLYGSPETASSTPIVEMTTAPPSSASEDGMDLQELLQSLGFAHWHKFLQDLFARYAGWLTHYWMEERFEVDLWPVEDVIKVLVAFPRARAGDDRAFALALGQCDFLARMARDIATGAEWDSRMESYTEFMSRHRAEPYWGHDFPWSQGDFAEWALSRIPPRDRPVPKDDAGP